VPSTALVLMAHDYKYDLPVLHKALATEVGYIGMLGSSRRGAAILKLLAEEGEGDAALKRIRVPIGLDIGARSAPEIALAVMAEIQAVRNGGTGQPMSTKPRRQDAPVSGPSRSEPGDQRTHPAPVSGHPRPEPGDERSHPPPVSGPPRPEPGHRPRPRRRSCSRPRGRKSTCSWSSPWTCTRRKPASGWPRRSWATASR